MTGAGFTTHKAEVLSLVDDCLRRQMTKEETMQFLQVQYHVDPGYTKLIWESLERENPEHLYVNRTLHEEENPDLLHVNHTAQQISTTSVPPTTRPAIASSSYMRGFTYVDPSFSSQYPINMGLANTINRNIVSTQGGPRQQIFTRCVQNTRPANGSSAQQHMQGSCGDLRFSSQYQNMGLTATTNPNVFRPQADPTQQISAMSVRNSRPANGLSAQPHMLRIRGDPSFSSQYQNMGFSATTSQNVFRPQANPTQQTSAISVRNTRPANGSSAQPHTLRTCGDPSFSSQYLNMGFSATTSPNIFRPRADPRQQIFTRCVQNTRPANGSSAQQHMQGSCGDLRFSSQYQNMGLTATMNPNVFRPQADPTQQISAVYVRNPRPANGSSAQPHVLRVPGGPSFSSQYLNMGSSATTSQNVFRPQANPTYHISTPSVQNTRPVNGLTRIQGIHGDPSFSSRYANMQLAETMHQNIVRPQAYATQHISTPSVQNTRPVNGSSRVRRIHGDPSFLSRYANMQFPETMHQSIVRAQAYSNQISTASVQNTRPADGLSFTRGTYVYPSSSYRYPINMGLAETMNRNIVGTQVPTQKISTTPVQDHRPTNGPSAQPHMQGIHGDPSLSSRYLNMGLAEMTNRNVRPRVDPTQQGSLHYTRAANGSSAQPHTMGIHGNPSFSSRNPNIGFAETTNSSTVKTEPVSALPAREPSDANSIVEGSGANVDSRDDAGSRLHPVPGSPSNILSSPHW